jgi:CheY-like chemotaxis protein
LADANQVELALLNLAVNARDAMPAGGTLTVALDATSARAGGSLPPGTYLRLAVTDDGAGMDAVTLQRAIEPFFSTKELGKGTGLGLSMIHGLAVQSNGALRLASEPGRGTRAELWLPATAARPQAAPAAAPAAQQCPEPATRLSIMVVDDDLLVAMGTVAMLDDLGHAVLEANSGPEALEILRGGQAVDLLVTDHAMPGMTGVQLAHAARALRPGLPVLLATGYADLPDGAGGELPRLAKPFQQRQLAAQIEALLGGAPARGASRVAGAAAAQA